MINYYKYEENAYASHFGILLIVNTITSFIAWIISMGNASLWGWQGLGFTVELLFFFVGPVLFLLKDKNGHRSTLFLKSQHLLLGLSSLYSGFFKGYWFLMVLGLICYAGLLLFSAMIVDCENEAAVKLKQMRVEAQKSYEDYSAKYDENLRRIKADQMAKQNAKIMQDYEKYIDGKRRWIKSALESRNHKNISTIRSLMDNLPEINADAIKTQDVKMSNSQYMNECRKLFNSYRYTSERKDLPNVTLTIGTKILDKDVIDNIDRTINELQNIYDSLINGSSYLEGINNYDQLVDKMIADKALFPDPPLNTYISTFARGDVKKIRDIILATRIGADKDKLDKMNSQLAINKEKLKDVEESFKTVGSYYRRNAVGSKGEYKVEEYIKQKKYPYLHDANLQIPGSDDSFESDFIWIRPEGIFVCEVKNYNFGKLNVDAQGNVTLETDTRTSNDSPIKQNDNHCVFLKHLLENGGLKKYAKCVAGLILVPNTGVSIQNEYNYPILSLPFTEAYIGSKKSFNLNDEDIKEIYKFISDNLQPEKEFDFTIPVDIDESVMNFKESASNLLNLLEIEKSYAKYQ